MPVGCDTTYSRRGHVKSNARLGLQVRATVGYVTRDVTSLLFNVPVTLHHCSFTCCMTFAQVDETTKSLPIALRSDCRMDRKLPSEPEVVHIDHVRPGNIDSEPIMLEQHVTACRLRGYSVGEAIAQLPYMQVCLCKVIDEKIKSDQTLAEIVQRVSDAQVIVILM